MTTQPSSRRVILWLIVVGWIVPVGIGLSIANQNLDISKLMLFLALFLWFRFHGRALSVMDVSIWLIIVCLIVLSAAFSSLTNNSASPILWAFFYVVGYALFFFVGKSVFRNPRDYVYYANLTAIVGLGGAAFYVTNYFFNFIDLESITTIEASRSTRGVIAGKEVIAYLGRDSVTSWYAGSRFVMLSVTAVGYLFTLNHDTLNVKRYVLLLATYVGVIEIALTQTRIVFVLSALIVLAILISQMIYRKRDAALTLLLMFAVVVFLDREILKYLATNISSLSSLIGFDNPLGGFTYNVGADKRVLALQGFGANYISDLQTILIGKGPMFWHFQDIIYGVPSEYFDDLSPILIVLMEFGVVVFFLLGTMVVIGIYRSKGIFGGVFALLFFLSIMSSIATFSPRNYFFLCLFLGAMHSSLSRKSCRESV